MPRWPTFPTITNINRATIRRLFFSRRKTILVCMMTRTHIFLAGLASLTLGVSAISMGTAWAAESAAPAGAKTPAAAPAENGARTFVDQVARRGIGFLSDPKLSQNQREESFRGLLRDSFDLTTIGRFVLGQYWRTATPAQRTEYQRLFEKMVVDVYSDRFSAYDGQQLNIAATKAVSDTDTMVTSYVVPKEGGEKVRVDWRVRQNDGRYRVVDVVVEGVSMSVTQRADFAGVLSRGNGDIAVLLDYMRNPKRG